MKNRRLLLLLACLSLPALALYPQERNARVEVVKPQDLKRAAFRLHISVEQLTNARAALKEATDLALGQDPPALNDYGALARLWVQLDRKQSRQTIASMIAQMSRAAESAEDLDSYRKYTSRAQELLFALNELDPEKAAQIADLWPAPSAKLGSAGEQALTQFQNDINNRLMSQAANSTPEQAYDQLQQPQKAASLPLAIRTQVAQALIYQNQGEKARALLDQAIADMGNRTLEPGKNYDFENFLRDLGRLYPEKFMGAFDVYRNMLAGQSANTNPGTVYQMGDQRVFLSSAEVTAMNLIRGMYSRPELSMKVLDSIPGLRDKLDQLGGLDFFLSANQSTVSYGGKSPVTTISRQGVSPNRGNSTPPDQPPNPSQLVQSLRGKAELNPELVRRKLSDAFRKKEYFSSLISVAQIANYQDPDLSSIALEVARGMLPLFDNLQERSSSLRSLIMTTRQCEGEVDAGLLKEGFLLVSQLREEENKKEQEAPPGSNANVYRPSNDLEISLISLTALSDFSAALRHTRALQDESNRIRALVQIAQSLTSNY